MDDNQVQDLVQVYGHCSALSRIHIKFQIRRQDEIVGVIR